jgi:hypothetical protein
MHLNGQSLRTKRVVALVNAIATFTRATCVLF